MSLTKDDQKQEEAARAATVKQSNREIPIISTIIRSVQSTNKKRREAFVQNDDESIVTQFFKNRREERAKAKVRRGKRITLEANLPYYKKGNEDHQNATLNQGASLSFWDRVRTDHLSPKKKEKKQTEILNRRNMEIFMGLAEGPSNKRTAAAKAGLDKKSKSRKQNKPFKFKTPV